MRDSLPRIVSLLGRMLTRSENRIFKISNLDATESLNLDRLQPEDQPEDRDNALLKANICDFMQRVALGARKRTNKNVGCGDPNREDSLRNTA